MALLSRLCNPLGDEIDGTSGQECSVPFLNSTLKQVPEDRTFSLFPFLPKELRLHIWEEATPRERLVHIHITWWHHLYRGDNVPVRYLEKNHLGKPISGSGYQINAPDGRLDHVLLSVNREARKVVLDFYRIQIPAFVAVDRQGRGMHSMTLRINPEHDVLDIKAEGPIKRTLVDFFWDMKAQDPKGVGVLKLALNLRDFCSNDLGFIKRSDLLLIRQRQVFNETLSQLREVWFINQEQAKQLPAYKRPAETPQKIVPFGIQMSGFECVGPETREGAEAELQKVYMGRIDPRELIWRWKRLLHRWDIHYPPGQVKYRLMVAQHQMSWKDDRGGKGLGRMMELLHLRDRDRGLFKVGACEAGGGSLADQVRPEESGGAKTAAVGFWSFPIEAAGEIGEAKRLHDLDLEPNRFLDLRSYWPELILAKMA